MSDAVLSLVVAGVGFAGVLVGVYATGVLNRQAEERREKREVRVAGRMAQLALFDLHVWMSVDAPTDEADAQQARELARRIEEELRPYLPTLAGQVSTATWTDVAFATRMGLQRLEASSDKHRAQVAELLTGALHSLETELAPELHRLAMEGGPTVTNLRDPDGTPDPPSNP